LDGDSDDQQRCAFDTALRKLPRVGHHHQVGFCHVVLSKDDAQRGEEDFAQAFSFEKLAKLAEETLGDVLVAKCRWGIHIQRSRQHLVPLPVVGQREEIVGRQQRPGLHGQGPGSHLQHLTDDAIVGRRMQRSGGSVELWRRLGGGEQAVYHFP
jgi:hypothetical protein